MSALVMALVAGMAVGDGPERVSTATEHGLCLDGYWKCTWQYLSDHGEVVTDEVMFKDGELLDADGQVAVSYGWKDVGKGRCLRFVQGGCALWRPHPCPGIYKRERGCLNICLNMKGGHYPSAFQVEKDCLLLTIRRVGPPK